MRSSAICGAVVGLVLLCAAAGALAQAPAAVQAPANPGANGGVYRIAGRIVNSISGEPLRHATVAVLSEEDSHTIGAVESDGDGHFALERLPAAKYQLTASKRGYRTAFYDEHELFNSAVVTGPDQDTGNLTFRLVPAASLHGTVTTDGGDPVENARVMLFQKSHEGRTGGRINQADTETTDDTGAYEFSNLAAGEYMIAVVAEPWYAMHRPTMETPRNGNGSRPNPPSVLDVAYPITFFDSTTDEAAATHLTLAGGGHDEADITLHAVPALRLQVETPRKANGSIARAELRQTVFGTVIGAESAGFIDSVNTGTTEFNGVAPGHYELVQGDPPRSVDFDATASVQVDPGVGTPAVSVHGALRSSTGAAFTDDCGLTLLPTDNVHRQNPIQTPCLRGGFNFDTVPAGQWQLLAEGEGKQLAVTSMAFDGKVHTGNILTVKDRPMTITVNIGQGSTRVQGFARRDGKGAAGVMVVLVPADLTALETTARRDQSDSDGSFALRDVAPGKYTLVAIEDGWGLDWAEPGVISRYLPGGIAVTVSDNSGKLVSLSAPVPVQTR